MFKRRILSLAVSIFLMMSVVACGSGDSSADTQKSQSEQATQDAKAVTTENKADEDQGEDDETAEVTQIGTLEDTPQPLKDPFEKYDPPISVTSVLTGNDGAFWFSGEDSLEDNIYTRRYLEQLGIQYEFKWTSPGSQREEKMNTMFASGDLPDFFTVNRQEFEKLYAAGSLEDITTPLIEYASEYTRQYLTGEYKLLLDVVTKDEKYFGITSGLSYKEGCEMIWIRKDWLDQLNLDVPKNVSDLENVMEEFKTNNPDGYDESEAYAIGAYSGTQQAWQWTMDIAFFNMFGSYPNGWYQNSKGELEDGLFGEEARVNTRIALEKAHEYFEKGYLSPNFAIMDNDMRNEELVNGKSGIMFGELWGAYWPLPLHLDTNPEADWIPISILSNTSEPGKVSRAAMSVHQILVARKGVEHPEALVKMVNLYHDLNNNPETMEFEEYNTSSADSNQMFLAFPLQIYSPEFNYEGYKQIAAAQDSGNFDGLCEAYKLLYDQAMSYENDGDLGGWPPYRSYLRGETSLSVTDEYVENKRIVFREYTADPTEFMIENSPIIKKMWDTMVISVITGDSDISAYDDFIASWDEMFGNTATREVNEWFIANGSKSIQDELG